MKKFENIILCSDIDGTLTNGKGEISKENLDAIEYFTDNGGKFVISTGRFYDYAGTTLGYKSKGPIIALNGAHIYDAATGKDIFKMTLNESEKNAIISLLEKVEGSDVPVYVHYRDHVSICKKADELRRALFCEKESFKAVFVSKKDVATELCEYGVKNFSHVVKTVKSTDTLTEVLPLGAGKHICIRKLREYFGEGSTVVAVGDYSNDIEMIRDADIGYAVENALDEVKAVAKRSAPKNTEHAIAFIVKELEEL